jgi:hypothetical protein
MHILIFYNFIYVRSSDLSLSFRFSDDNCTSYDDNVYGVKLLSAYQKKIPASNATYAHAQDFAASDELLLAILKAFIPQPLNKQETKDFHVFWWIQCDSMQNIITTPTVHSVGALTTRYTPLLDVFCLYVVV